MRRDNRLIALLAVLAAVLAGALIFLAARMTAPGAAPAANEAAAVGADAKSDDGMAEGPASPAEVPASPVAPDPPQPLETDAAMVPPAFLGEWNREPAACGTGLNDSALRIEPRVLRFYESRGDVLRVTREGERAVAVEARFEGEGETWTETVRMMLSPSGDALTIGGLVRRRCG